METLGTSEVNLETQGLLCLGWSRGGGAFGSFRKYGGT